MYRHRRHLIRRCLMPRLRDARSYWWSWSWYHQKTLTIHVCLTTSTRVENFDPTMKLCYVDLLGLALQGFRIKRTKGRDCRHFHQRVWCRDWSKMEPDGCCIEMIKHEIHLLIEIYDFQKLGVFETKCWLLMTSGGHWHQSSQDGTGNLKPCQLLSGQSTWQSSPMFLDEHMTVSIGDLRELAVKVSFALLSSFALLLSSFLTYSLQECWLPAAATSEEA